MNQMDERRIKWGIIGLGNIAIEFADAIKETGTLVIAHIKNLVAECYRVEIYMKKKNVSLILLILELKI